MDTPTIDGPEVYSKLAKYLQEYLGTNSIDNEIFLLMVMPSVFIIIYILFQFMTASRRPKHAPKDLEFFDSVILQKGLENADRDLLLQLADHVGIVPIYQILLEAKVFQRAFSRIHEEVLLKKSLGHLHQNIEHLRALEQKLFP